MIAVLGLITLIISSCGVEVEDPVIVQKEPINVAVQTKEQSLSVTETISYPGTVVSEQEVRVVAKTSGTVSNVLFSVGDVVSEGQTLVTLDEGKDNPARTNYETSLAGKSNVETTLQNVQQMTNEQIKQATIGVEQARTNYEMVKRNYDSLVTSAQKDIKQAEIAKNQAETGAKNVDITTTETYKTAKIAYETAKIATEQARISLENRKKLATQGSEDMLTNAKTASDTVFNLCGTVIDNINSITGFDENNLVSIPYQTNLGALKQQDLIDAKNVYTAVSKMYLDIKTKHFDSASDQVQEILALAQQAKMLVDATKSLLDNTITSTILPQNPTVSGGLSLSGLKTGVVTMQTQINSAILQLQNVQQGLINIDLNNKTLIDSLEKAYELAQQQEIAAQQNLSNLLAGTTAQKDQAGYGVQAAENQYENIRLKIQAQLNTAKSSLDIASLQYKNAQTALENAKIAQKNQLDTIRSQMDSIQGQVSLAKIQYDNLVISTPISGTIIKKTVSIGDTVSAGQQVAVVSQTKKLKVQLYVDQQYVSALVPGMGSIIRDNNNQTFSGAILSISPQADSMTKRFLVEVLPTEQTSFPAAGMVVKVLFTVNRYPTGSGTILLPLSAVSVGQNANHIFIIDNNVAKQIPVVVKMINGEYVELEIDHMYNNNTQIVIDGNKLLKNGDPISIDNKAQM